MKLLFAVCVLWLCSVASWAECACVCVGGQARTLCSTVAEAQGNPSLCSAARVGSCPLEDAAEEGATFEAPTDGATNCRSERIWDARLNGYTDAKVCDVLTPG